MKLKASIDVENINDFRQYYEGSYVRHRVDEAVLLHIHTVRVKQEEVLIEVLRRDAPEGGGMIVVPYRDLPALMVYGKAQYGMVPMGGKLFWVHQPNNRVGRRGYHPGEVNWLQLGTGEYTQEWQNRRDQMEREAADNVHAVCCVFPVYTPYREWDGKEDVAFSPLYGAAYSSKHDAIILFRRSKMIGHLDTKLNSFILGPTEYKQYANFLSTRIGVKCNERLADK